MVVDGHSAGELTPQQALAQIGYIRELVDRTRMQIVDFYAVFFVWGAALIIGYAVMALHRADIAGLPRVTQGQTTIVWIAVLVGAAIVQQLVPVRAANSAGPTLGRQLSLISVCVLVVGLILVPLYLRANIVFFDGYITLWVGVAYVMTAIFMGWEQAVIGGWIVGASIAVRFIDRSGAFRQIWLGATVGGGLIVTGALFRRRSRGQLR